jgi:adenine-specific DNA methylase
LGADYTLVCEEPEKGYHAWFLRLCGILGDPVAAKRASLDAKAGGARLRDNPFTYKPAFKNVLSSDDLGMLHAVLLQTWGEIPSLIDPTAGGGSIPYEAIRYGIPATANDLNPVAASVLRVGVEIPARYGVGLRADLDKWGRVLVGRLIDRVADIYPWRMPDEPPLNYIFARSVACPRTGKPVPLCPDWWLSKDRGGVAVRLLTHRGGIELEAPQFELVSDNAIDFDPDNGTINGGDAVSPWDGRVIDGDYVKNEAREGRMGSVLYAVAVRSNGRRAFRAPTEADLEALTNAQQRLDEIRGPWSAEDVLPTEAVPQGLKTQELRASRHRCGSSTGIRCSFMR